MTTSVFDNNKAPAPISNGKRSIYIRGIAIATLILLSASLLGCMHKPKPTFGPPLVVFIVDRTASTSDIQKQLLKYSSDALSEYSKDGPMHFVLINLDEKPTVAMEKSGDLTREQIEDILSRIKNIDYKGKGTDIVSAFDKAYEYYNFEKKKPSSFRILCFTDGLVEAPRGQIFRKWSKIDTGKFKNSEASIGVYFIDSAVRQQVEGALSGTKFLIKEKNQAISEVKEEKYDLPGITQ